MTQDEIRAEAEAIEMKEQIESAEGLLRDTKRKYDVKIMEQRQGDHMIDRMKADLVALKLESNLLHETYKNKEIIMKDEFVKYQKAREDQLQSKKFHLDHLMRNIDNEQEKR